MESGKVVDGGPAFPSEQGHTPEGKWNQSYEPGMTLRDWFAGQALAGLIADEAIADTDDNRALDARRCYAMADAMLAARTGSAA